MAARKWIEFVRLMLPGATQDLDAIKRTIDDGWANLRVKNQLQREELDKKRLRDATRELADARTRQAELRAALLLDDED